MFFSSFSETAVTSVETPSQSDAAPLSSPVTTSQSSIPKSISSSPSLPSKASTVSKEQDVYSAVMAAIMGNHLAKAASITDSPKMSSGKEGYAV